MIWSELFDFIPNGNRYVSNHRCDVKKLIRIGISFQKDVSVILSVTGNRIFIMTADVLRGETE